MLIGGAAIYGATQSLFNVEGGHRAIVFNRLSGIKERVSCHLMAFHAFWCTCALEYYGRSRRCSLKRSIAFVTSDQADLDDLGSLRRCMKKGHIS